jgi:hypothetical protein
MALSRGRRQDLSRLRQHFAVLGTFRMTGRGEAQRIETWAAELPKLSTSRPVQNSVDNAKGA